MNIGIITPRYPPNTKGGGEISVQLLAENLTSRDSITSINVFTIDGDGYEEINGVNVIRLGESQHKLMELTNLSFLARLGEDLLTDIDLLHAYNMELHPATGYLSSKMDIPSVATLNSYRFFRKDDINVEADIERRIYEALFLPTTGRLLLHYIHKIDGFSVLSDASRRVYRQNGFENEYIKHISNMVDPEFSVEPIEDNTESVELLYIGGLRPAKGVPHLIKSVKYLPSEYNLRIVGRGKLRPKIELLVSELELADSVDIVGSVPYEEIPNQYAMADLFIHPGVWPEPGNRTTLEAMQAGLPVVCTDVGGPPELLPNQDYTCEPGNPQDMAEKILQASQEADKIGNANQSHVAGKYTPYKVTSEFIKLYNEIIDIHNFE